MIDYTESAREREVGNCTYLVNELRIPIVWGSQGIGATLGKVGVAVRSWGSWQGQNCAERPWVQPEPVSHLEHTHQERSPHHVPGQGGCVYLAYFSFLV